MADSNDSISRLVEIIAERVVAQMQGGALQGVRSAALKPLRETECSDGPTDENCSACGYCVTRRPWAVSAIAGEGACRVGAGVDVGQVDVDMARMIDHTLLRADATAADVQKLCDEARKFCFASVCVNTSHVGRAKALLRGSGVMVCAVVGFPLGAMLPNAKAFEAKEAVRCGADEIDMVINIGALKGGEVDTVFEDVASVVAAAQGRPVKVILETSMLNREQKIAACAISKAAGAAFVKTSTGFGGGGATAEDVALMRAVVGPDVGVKASGGIRNTADARAMLAAGANRLGASASVAIVRGGSGQGGY